MKKTFCRLLAVTAFILLSGKITPAVAAAKEKAALRDQIHRVIKETGIRIGFGVTGLDFQDSLLVNGHEPFPMQSVFKFPLAIAVLHLADQGRLSLTQRIHITRASLDTDTWSPMVKDFPGQDIDITLADLLKYTVSKSDNNGCDALFRLAGGTAAVNRYIQQTGVSGMAIKATEAGMKANWQVQYSNACEPAAMLQLLQLFYRGKTLSAAGTAFLMKIMTESENPEGRIKGLLPEHTVVAHKTGTSGTNRKGITAATNDIGIISLPDGRHIAVVAYVSDFTGGTGRAEKIIARLTRMVWDYYTSGN